MKTKFRASFARDLKKLNDPSMLQEVRQAIEDVEMAADLRAIGRLKKMSAGGNFYRIRVGQYRIEISVEGDEVEFVR